MKAAVIAGLHLLIQAAYKRVTGGGVGTWMYQTTNDQMEIIRELRCLYGGLSPAERESMDTKWNEPWNTAMPIKHYFKGSQETFIGGNVHPHQQISTQLQDGSNGREGKNRDGEMWIIPNPSEWEERVHGTQPGLGKHDVTCWRSVWESIDLGQKIWCHGYNC